MWKSSIFLLLLLGCSREGGTGSVEGVVAEVPSKKQQVGDFTLLDHRGDARSLSWNSDSKLVVIIGQENGCPTIRKFSAQIRELKRKFEPRGVVFYLINANPKDSRQKIIDEDNEAKYELPILMDPSQVVTKELGITQTAEAVVIETKGLNLLYRGAIDELQGSNGKKYLENAIEDALAARKVANQHVPAGGTPFVFFDQGELNYTRDIAPIFRAKCLRCHSPNGFYPPFLNSYEAIRGWSSMIRETLLTDRMPPFSGDTFYGTYSNDISLSPADKARLVAWIDSGMKKGEGDDPLKKIKLGKQQKPLPPKIWELSMKAPQKIAPKGTVEYLFFEVAGPAPHDMWVTAMNTISNNPTQLHHESLLVVPHPWSYYQAQLAKIRDDELAKKHPDGDIPLWTMDVMTREQSKRDSNFVRFGAFAAGLPQPHRLSSDTAYFIPKGHYVILEVHYVGNGKEDQEQTKIELFGFTNETKPASLRRIRTLQILTTQFEIPPGVKKFVATSKPLPIKKSMVITGIRTHMHMRGRAVRLLMEDPSGKEKVLASIPNYDFNWQSGLGLHPSTPITVKKGSKLKAVCEYDNSSANPRNPDSSRSVRHGQTLDRAEMCKVMLAYMEAD